LHGSRRAVQGENPVSPAIFRRILLAAPLQRDILGLTVEKQIPISDPARGATRRAFSPQPRGGQPMRISIRIPVLALLVLSTACAGKSPEATEPATVEPQVDYARQPAPEIEAEVLAYLNTLDEVVAKLDVDALNALHMYDSDKFIRVEASMPRMGLAEGKAREDDYFRMIDKFESSFSDSRIDVIGPRQAIVTRRYKYQGFKEGKALHPVLDVWLTLVLVKDVKDDRWKIIYESLVPAT
jgi:hypothetical protein